MNSIYGIAFFGLFLSFSYAASAQKSAEQNISMLAWLEGRWERVQSNIEAGQTAFEEWVRENKSFTGEGITMRGADTVFVEKLSIKFKDGTLYYVADVNPNDSPVYFRITEISQSGFICENPGHDFPKKIEYRLEAVGGMKAIISGNGKSIPFVFRKVRNG